ncbi:hypothetical protein GOBAR_AA34698 [Gossypium barbadense]|uniref:Uncharacterized protein n=1 Tax=Gossypium barbadense TaxID=3634 RepID=A0A2P5W4G9_GOSBA|nr:hypothetical protein GOBAR_AA34698 [Gossypium barbadense]
MLTKFISVSETRFQNTKTTLKNQQALIQGLKNQIGQLAKLISERPQGSLPRNTKTNPREQLHAITVRDEEGLVEAEPELRQESVVSQGKVKVIHNVQKPKLKLHDAKPKRLHEELKDGTNHLKAWDYVLLDETDPQIATLKLNKNGATPFTVLNVFPYGTVEVTHSEFGTFKVNITRLKPYFINRFDSEKEEFRLREPP